MSRTAFLPESLPPRTVECRAGPWLQAGIGRKACKSSRTGCWATVPGAPEQDLRKPASVSIFLMMPFACGSLHEANLSGSPLFRPVEALKRELVAWPAHWGVPYVFSYAQGARQAARTSSTPESWNFPAAGRGTIAPFRACGEGRPSSWGSRVQSGIGTARGDAKTTADSRLCRTAPHAAMENRPRDQERPAH